jgi:hypothetical protein
MSLQYELELGGQINLNPFSLGSIPQGFNHQIEDGIDADMDAPDFPYRSLLINLH